ncbi:MAG: anaerobic sulfatase maturase [Planctomycetaceae bacterium]|nr:anaerobic sulfatase maturase [Planctomycetaceae bacterium]
MEHFMAPPNEAADGDTPLRVVPIVKGQRRFNVMAKPIGPACNLDCVYCYYLSKERLLGLTGHEPISDPILEKFIVDYISGNDAPEVEFEWQGGEPTLLGVEFFRKVVDMQRRHCPPNRRFLNSLQTNGLLLDDEWCRFLRENRFLVGLSIDGPRKLHDAYRVAKGGQPTFDRVFAAAKLLKKHRVDFNTLTVVHRLNAKRPLDVYRFLSREVGPRIMQFIPLVEPRGFATVAPGLWDKNNLPLVGTHRAKPGTPDSIVTDWSVDPDDYGAFLCKVFDEWHQRDLGKYFVNLFESCAAVWMGRPAQICVFQEFCGKALLLERDSQLYSCDHFVYPEYRLGNLLEQPLVDMVFSGRQVRFGFAKTDTLPEYCRECEFLFACWGECPRNRFVRSPEGEPGLNYLCPGLLRFFLHADERLKKIAEEFHGYPRQVADG